MNLTINQGYEIVIYNGRLSKTIRGNLIAALNYDELRRYGYNAAQLQTVHYPLLPNGTPFDFSTGTWYIFRSTDIADGLTAIYSSWIKPNGISEVEIKYINLSGSFKSGRSLTDLHNAFINEGINDLSLSLVKGQIGESITTPEIGVQYKMSLSDTDNSSIWGIYQATVSYDLLPQLGISGEMEYSNYSWDSSRFDMLTRYRWMVFSSIDNPGIKFAIAEELLSGPLREDTNQGIFEFNKVGLEGDVAHIRSVLNIQSATNIIIGTNS